MKTEKLSDLGEKILDIAIEYWLVHHSGISGLRLAGQLDIDNQLVMQELELMEELGVGSLNRNAKFGSPMIIVSDAPPTIDVGGDETYVTHVFFPDKHILRDYFYNNLVKKNFPEYVARLHMGDSPYDLVFFSLEVLSKYQDHPEKYIIDDSLSGGNISTTTNEEENYLHVTFGKRKLGNDEISICACIKDLSLMGTKEQLYWHSFELTNPDFSLTDPHFEAFVARYYGGSWDDFTDLLGGITMVLESINSKFGEMKMFRKIANPHLSIPTANTLKQFIDCCSELFKIVGTDSLNSKVLKQCLSGWYNYGEEDFIHSESGRPKSSLQLFQMLDGQVNGCSILQGLIKEIGSYRMDADHRILDPTEDSTNYVAKFNELCERLLEALKNFDMRIQQIQK